MRARIAGISERSRTAFSSPNYGKRPRPSGLRAIKGSVPIYKSEVFDSAIDIPGGDDIQSHAWHSGEVFDLVKNLLSMHL